MPWIVSFGTLAVFFVLRLLALDETNGGRVAPPTPIIVQPTASDAVSIRSALVAWRGSCFGLIACSIAYLVLALDGVRRFAPRSEMDRYNSGKALFVLAVSCLVGFLAFAVAMSIRSDLRTSIILDAARAQVPFVPESAHLVVSCLWGVAVCMAFAAVWTSWIVVRHFPRPRSRGQARARGSEFAQAILDRVRWSRKLLLVGCIGPAAGVVEIVSLSVLAARCVEDGSTKHTVLVDQIIWYGRASALETGFLFTLIQVAVYLPVALATYHNAEVLANLNRRGNVGRDGFDRWMKECGLKDGSSVEPIARLLAVLSPIVAALIANVIALPKT